VSPFWAIGRKRCKWLFQFALNAPEVVCKARCQRLVVGPPNHSFTLPSNVFSTALHIRLNFSHPLILRVSHCICSQHLDPMGIHLLHCIYGEERMASHDVVWDVFAIIMKDVRFHVLRNRPMPFHPLPYNLCVVKSTLCYQSMVSTHW
jgi:hypothetical protein